MKPVKILVIEDEQDAREQYARKLRKAGFVVDEAESATEGWKRFREHLYPVVVTDLRMIGIPSIDGLEALEKIKQFRPAAQVIVVTGHGAEDDAIKSLKFHAFDYFKKGLSSLPNDLVKSVHRAIEEYRRQSDEVELDFGAQPPADINQVRDILKEIPPLKDIINQENEK